MDAGYKGLQKFSAVHHSSLGTYRVGDVGKRGSYLATVGLRSDIYR